MLLIIIFTLQIQNEPNISINHFNSLVKVEKDIPFPLALCHDIASFFFSFFMCNYNVYLFKSFFFLEVFKSLCNCQFSFWTSNLNYLIPWILSLRQVFFRFLINLVMWCTQSNNDILNFFYDAIETCYEIKSVNFQ